MLKVTVKIVNVAENQMLLLATTSKQLLNINYCLHIFYNTIITKHFLAFYMYTKAYAQHKV